MGYTTDFDGQITIASRSTLTKEQIADLFGAGVHGGTGLNPHEIAYLKRFAATRRMKRKLGPYYCGSGFAGQDNGPDIIDYNDSPHRQPNLWCQWVPNEDGTALVWDQGEKFYDAELWMAYLIDTFLRPGARLQEELKNPISGRWYAPEFQHFTFDHSLNGTVWAQGEDFNDRWKLVVENNDVTVNHL